MREFKKSSKLENVLYDVRGPVVDEAARLEKEGQRILKLNIGNPAPFGFRTPDEVIQDMRHQLPECEGYSDSRGLFSARKAIMQYAQLKHIPNVDMDSIYTGNGVSELIQLCMQACGILLTWWIKQYLRIELLERIYKTAYVLLMILMVFVVFNDIRKLFF